MESRPPWTDWIEGAVIIGLVTKVITRIITLGS